MAICHLNSVSARFTYIPLNAIATGDAENNSTPKEFSFIGTYT